MSGKRYDLDVGKQCVRARFRRFVEKRIFERKQQRVLCFPGEYGHEIESVYRKLGFRDENIYGVERDKKAARAIRLNYPKINLYEGDLLDFVQDYQGPPFTVISLDYCGHFGEDKLKPLGMLALRGLIAERAVIATNLFAGREKADEQDYLRHIYVKVLQDRAGMKGKVLGSEASWAEFMGVIDTAREEELATVRDDAITYMTISLLSYLISTYRLCETLGLKQTRGHAVQLSVHSKLERLPDGTLRIHGASIQADGTVTEEHPDGRKGVLTVLKDAPLNLPNDSKDEVIHSVLSNDRSALWTNRVNIFAIPIQVKHEAIYDVNAELKERGVPEAMRVDGHRRGYMRPDTDYSWLDYHLGRTLVMAWFDKYGYPHLPVALERYSYISESGKRMISDFFDFRTLRGPLDALPDGVQPFLDKATGKHRFMLHPAPETFPSVEAYHDFAMGIVTRYAKGVAAKMLNTDEAKYIDRLDLGGGQSMPFDEEKVRVRIIERIKKGQSNEEIAAKVRGASVGTIRALRAHVTRGSYSTAPDIVSEHWGTK